MLGLQLVLISYEYSVYVIISGNESALSSTDTLS